MSATFLISTRRSAMQSAILLGISAIILISPLWAQSDKGAQSDSEIVDGRVDSFNLPGVEPDFQGSEVHRYQELPPDAKQLIPKKEKKTPFTGYTKVKDYFLHLCNALYEDGRSLKVAKFAEPYKGGVVGCRACKTFFRLLFSQCNKTPPKYRAAEIKLGNRERALALLRTRAKGLKESEEGEATENTPSAEAEIDDSPEGDGDEPSHEEKIQDVEAEVEELRRQLPNKQFEPHIVVIDAALRFSQMLADDGPRREDHFQALEYLEKELRNPEDKTEGEKVYFDILQTYLEAPFLEFERIHKKLKKFEGMKKEQRNREFMLDSNQIFGESEKME